MTKVSLDGEVRDVVELDGEINPDYQEFLEFTKNFADDDTLDD